MFVPLKTMSSSATEVGRVHRSNEDAFFVDDAHREYAVSDGMGGHPGGREASQIVVETMREALCVGSVDGEVRDRLLGAVDLVMQRLDRVAARVPDLRGMGATLTLLLLEGDRRWIAHVGDSRAYLVRNRQLVPLTEDHSLAYELHELGIIGR